MEEGDLTLLLAGDKKRLLKALDHLRRRLAKDHDLIDRYKANLCSLKNLVLVGATGDTIIEPLESEHFGFYKNGSKEEFERVQDWSVYKEDRLGLKTLDESGRLRMRLANCNHCGLPEDLESYIMNILPFIAPIDDRDDSEVNPN